MTRGAINGVTAFSVLAAVAVQASVVNIYVNQQSNYSSLPCGMNSSTAACPTVINAFRSIQSLSNESYDSINVLFSPGDHSVCNVSYVNYAGQLTNRSLTLAPLNPSLNTNLSCSGNQSILIFDYDGVQYLVQNLTFVVSGSFAAINFTPTVNRTSTTTYTVSGCSFFSSVPKQGTGVYLNVPRTFNGYFFLQISYSFFSSLSMGISTPSTSSTMKASVVTFCVFYNNSFGISTMALNGYVNAAFLNFSRNVYDLQANNRPTMRINDSNFEFGILWKNYYSTFFFTNCTITNQAAGSTMLWGTEISFTNCIIKDTNTASGLFTVKFDGRVGFPEDFFFKNVTFINLSSDTGHYLFSGNNPKNASFDSCIFYHRSDQRPIFNFQTRDDYPQYNMTFKDCRFVIVGSSVLNRTLFALNGQVYPQNTFSLINCTFSNFVMNSPSAVFSFQTVWNVKVINCTFDNIQSTGMGLIIIGGSGNFTISGSTFSNIYTTFLIASYSTTPVIHTSTFRNITISIIGLIWLPNRGTLFLSSSTFSKIKIANRGALVAEQNSQMTVVDCTFLDFDGRPPIFVGMDSQISLLRVTISRSSSFFSGGCAFVDSRGDLSINQTTFINCSSAGNGGVVFVNSQGRLQVFSSKFMRNSAALNGGAFFLANYSGLSIFNSTIKQNLAQKDGGGFYLQGNTNVSCIGTQFSENVVLRYGGAIYLSAAAFVLNGSIFSFNSALQGGGIYSQTFSFDNSSMNNSFLNNSAVYTGTFGCNSTQGSGGGLFVDLVKLSELKTLSGWSFMNNFAAYYGGGFGFAKIINDSPFSESVLGRLENNSALYGPNFGSLWVHFTASFANYSFIDEPFGLIYTFQDMFAQNAVGVECPLDQIVNQSTPITVSVSPSEVYIRQNSDGFQRLNSTLFFPFKLSSPLPFPNSSVTFSGVVQLKSSSGSTLSFNITRELCPSGAEFVVDADSITAYSCRSCRAGTFLSFSNGQFAFCQECPLGKLSKESSTMCSLCPAGFTTSEVSASVCVPCSSGSFNPEDGGDCMLCPINQYTSFQGSPTCANCFGNSVTINQGSPSAYFCVCREGEYGQPWNNQTCKKCVESSGAYCDLNSSIPIVSPGFWRDPQSLGNVYECIPSYSCQSTGLNISTSCEYGYRGKRCGECLRPDYFHFDNVCKKCGDQQVSTSVIIAILLLCAMFLMSSISRQSNLNSMDLQIILYSLQIIALYPRLSKTWPPVVKSLLDSASVSVSYIIVLQICSCFSQNFNLENIFLWCVLPDDFWFGHAFKVSTPLMVLCLLNILAGTVYLVQRWKKSQTLAKHLNANPFERAFSLYVAMSVGMYIYVLTAALEPFRCLEQPDKSLTLVSSPNLDCFDPQWSQHWASIGFGLFFMVFIPIGLFYTLWRFRHSLESNWFQWRFGLLTSRYKQNYYWWSLYLLVKKTLLVMLIDLTNSYSVHIRSYFVLILLISALAIESLCKPRKYNDGAFKIINFG
jgi:hypothetical protein